MAVGNSYDFADVVRDLSGAYMRLIANAPTLISRVRRVADAISTKHEWLEEQLTPTSSAIGSFDVDGDGTGVNVASTTGFAAGQILRVVQADGDTPTELLRVTSVDSATDLTLSRDYGATTGYTLLVGDVLHVVALPRNEGSTVGTGTAGSATAVFNYTQIDDEVAAITKTAQAIKMHGVESAINDAVQRRLSFLIRKQNQTLIHGVKVARTVSEAGMAGGLNYFLSTGNQVTISAAVTPTLLNNSFEAIFADGGGSNEMTIVCAPNQARKISAFNTSGTNPVIQQQRTDTTSGSFVSTFRSDLPALQGMEADIYVDPTYPKDKIAIVDMSRVGVSYLRPLTDEDATANGEDSFVRRLLHEYTFEVRDAAYAHALLNDCNV